MRPFEYFRIKYHHMKYCLSLLLVCISFLGIAQDLNYKLAGASHKKCIGDNLGIDNARENNTVLTFYKNRTVIEYNDKYKSGKPVQKWQFVSGEFADANDIILQIGKKQYSVEFSKTNNGKDFMILSSGGGDDDANLVVRTFHAE